VQAIEQAASRLGAKGLLTTEKDSCNLSGLTFESLPIYVCIIDLKITGDAEFLGAINGVLQTRGAQA
jgi:hypothetical protein